MDISAEKLKQLRLTQGLTQELLARQSGLSLRTIQRLEQEGGGSAESLLALAATLNVAPAQLRQHHTLPLANWTLVNTSFKIGVIIILCILVCWPLYLGSSGRLGIFVDLVTAIFLLLYVSCLTILSGGFAGIRLTLRGLSLLFSRNLIVSSDVAALKQLYQLQYKLCYSGALVLNLIGLISLLAHSASSTDDIFKTGIAVLALSWLYAAILAEGILRPLLYKLEPGQ